MPVYTLFGSLAKIGLGGFGPELVLDRFTYDGLEVFLEASGVAI